MPETPTITVEVLLDPADWAAHLADETRRGLVGRPPSTPPVWFYDDRGSALFDEITRLPEYYPTRAEREILMAHAGEIATLAAPETLIELGSGTSEKTRLLLDAFVRQGSLRRFVPFDCSEATLRVAADAVAAEWPGLTVHAVVGDFHHHLGRLPTGGRRLMAFLGSTVGNLDAGQRSRFLAAVRATLVPGDWFLLGTDLVKDRGRLLAAYDDPAGITALFDLNALVVMNRELDADFDPSAYDHVAHWNEAERWIEMRLVARRDQRVRFGRFDGLTVDLPAGRWLRTEISAKFTPEGVVSELEAAGLAVEARWTDVAGDFQLTLARA